MRTRAARSAMLPITIPAIAPPGRPVEGDVVVRATVEDLGSPGLADEIALDDDELVAIAEPLVEADGVGDGV
jgi:hypothetical protein